MRRRWLPLIPILILLPVMANAEGMRDDPNAPCDPRQPVCLLDSGLDPAVSLHWQELSPPRRIPPLPRWVSHLPPHWQELVLRWWNALFAGPDSVMVRGKVTLVAQNETRRHVRAQVRLQPWGLRRDARLPEFDIVLGPSRKHRLPIDLTSLGFDLSRPNSLVGVRAVVQSYGQTGRSSAASERLDQTFSPMLYLQRRDPSARTLRAFGEDQLDRFVNAPAQSGPGNPFCTLTIPDPEEELELAIDPGPGDPDPAQDFSVGPPGAGEIKFCFALPVDTKDSGIGEDQATNPTTNFPASHAQVKIQSLPPEIQTVVDDAYLDADGCVAFEHVSNPGYTVKLTGRARVPRSDNPVQSNMLTIQSVDVGPPLQVLGVPAWYWCSDEDLEAGDTKWFYANPNRRTNLLGMAIFSLRRFSDGVSDSDIFVQDRPCSTNPSNSCNTATGNSTVQIHPDHNQYRYAISHEMGHRILRDFLGAHPLPCGAYAVNSGGPACEWELSHALHSKEFAAGAFNEGWAQFYATAVYNDLSETDAWFHYYKEDYKDGAVTVVDMEGDLVGGSTAYLDTICEEPHDGFGVELDWARQLWDFMSDPGLKPTRLQLMQQIQIASESDWNLANQTESMNDAAMSLAGGAYAERWLETAEQNGVDPGFTDDCFWSVPCSMTSCSTPCTVGDCPCSACDP